MSYTLAPFTMTNDKTPAPGRVSRTYRLDSSLVDVLQADANRRGISEREAVEIILRDHYLHGSGLADRVAALERSLA